MSVSLRHRDVLYMWTQRSHGGVWYEFINTCNSFTTAHFITHYVSLSHTVILLESTCFCTDEDWFKVKR